MKLLIVYGTTEGQTRKICEFIRDKATEAGHEVTLIDSTENELLPENFSAVLIAASVHAGNYQSSVRHYITKYHTELNEIPSTFVSVSLTAAGEEPESWKELEDITDEFLDTTGWEPTHVAQVAGALRYTEYNFLKKYLMRMIAQKSGGNTDTSSDHEYTDWKQVERLIYQLQESFESSQNQKPVHK